MNHTAKDIARMLADRAESVCRHLLPSGKRNGQEYEVGSVYGEAGHSLKVHLTGAKAGVWCDFATGDKGDMLDLWTKARNLKLNETIREAKQHLGLRDPSYLPLKKSYAKPAKAGIKKLGTTSRVIAYLTEQRRLTTENLDQFKVSEKGDFMVFPYFSPEGELVNIKSISVDRVEGKKIVYTEKDCAPGLFGWQAMDETARAAVICEGEIDAITLHQYGLCALSVPFGAGRGNKNAWIDYEWENLERFDTIYLCYDFDEAGQASIEEVSERLGIHRCKVVTLPHKDANECLQKDVGGDIIAKAFIGAKNLQPAEICDAGQFVQAVTEYFYPKSDKKGFSPLPFVNKICFRPGELTVWTGISGHGKSLFLGELMLHAMKDDEKVAIASMEMKPCQTLGRMLRQFWVKDLPTEDEIKRSLEAFSGRLWVYDLLGNVPTHRLVELMQYSRCRHGVTQFVVDSLMKCGVDSDDYNAQREFLNDIVSFSKRHHCHIHLVAHPRKGNSEDEIVGKMSIKGSSDIYNQADNCLTVWRNKPKEERLRNNAIYTFDEPDAIVYCDKQRETGWEGQIPLIFFPQSLQYADKVNLDPSTGNPRAYNFWNHKAFGLCGRVEADEMRQNCESET